MSIFIIVFILVLFGMFLLMKKFKEFFCANSSNITLLLRLLSILVGAFIALLAVRGRQNAVHQSEIAFAGYLTIPNMLKLQDISNSENSLETGITIKNTGRTPVGNICYDVIISSQFVKSSQPANLKSRFSKDKSRYKKFMAGNIPALNECSPEIASLNPGQQTQLHLSFYNNNLIQAIIRKTEQYYLNKDQSKAPTLRVTEISLLLLYKDIYGQLHYTVYSYLTTNAISSAEQGDLWQGFTGKRSTFGIIKQ